MNTTPQRQPVDYQRIQPLVETVNDQGGVLHVTFQCSETGHKAQAQAKVEGSSKMGEMVKSGLMMMLISMVQNWIFRRMGLRGRRNRRMGRRMTRGMGRDLLGGSGRSSRRGNNRGGSRSGGDGRQQAIVKAFSQVQDQFVWDEGRGQWIHRSGQ